ncbi:hypothetical protein BDV3_005807 [Batrachochytrium dendrobatidis]
MKLFIFRVLRNRQKQEFRTQKGTGHLVIAHWLSMVLLADCNFPEQETAHGTNPQLLQRSLDIHNYTYSDGQPDNHLLSNIVSENGTVASEYDSSRLSPIDMAKHSSALPQSYYSDPSVHLPLWSHPMAALQYPSKALAQPSNPTSSTSVLHHHNQQNQPFPQPSLPIDAANMAAPEWLSMYNHQPYISPEVVYFHDAISDTLQIRHNHSYGGNYVLDNLAPISCAHFGTLDLHHSAQLIPQPSQTVQSHHNSTNLHSASIPIQASFHHQWNPHSYRRFNRAAGQTRFSTSKKSSKSHTRQVSVDTHLQLPKFHVSQYDYAYAHKSVSQEICCGDEDWHEVQSAADSIDTGTSTEINSMVESLLTQSSRTSSLPNEPSSEERRLEQRQKQIDYGKNTVGYRRYLECVPKNKRQRGDPETPERHSKCSKRAWDAHVRSWRRRLHQYDPPGDPSVDCDKDMGFEDGSKLNISVEMDANMARLDLYDDSHIGAEHTSTELPYKTYHFERTLSLKQSPL